MRRLIFLIIALLFISLASASLGISPAKKSFDFYPGEVIEIDYTAISDSPDRKVEVYAEGDLAQYVTFDRKTFNGGGGFHATISLPNSIDVPGGHRLLIGVRESPVEGQFLGAVINIRSVVDIFVPYPGKYIEASLKVPHGNIDEIIPIEFHISNRGKESLEIDSSLDIISAGGEIIFNKNFDRVSLVSTEEHLFRTVLNTSGVKPGTYSAKATINYGDIFSTNTTFNIGSLFVNISNFTTFLPKDNIQKFYINVESRWNGILQGVYGEVNVSNQTYNIVFKTPSIGLGAWEKGELVGYLDTSFLEGDYNTAVDVFYADYSTRAFGKLNVSLISADMTLLVWIGAAIAALIIVAAVLFVLRKKKKKRK